MSLIAVERSRTLVDALSRRSQSILPDRLNQGYLWTRSSHAIRDRYAFLRRNVN